MCVKWSCSAGVEIKFPGKDIFHSMCVLMGVCVQTCEGNTNMYDDVATELV